MCGIELAKFNLIRNEHDKNISQSSLSATESRELNSENLGHKTKRC